MGWPPEKPVTLHRVRSLGESSRRPIIHFLGRGAEPAPSSCKPLRHTAYGLGIFWPGKIPAQANAGSFGVPMVNLGFFLASVL